MHTKLIEKIPDSHNAKEHYQERKTHNQEKKTEIITYQPNTFENSDIVDIKSSLIGHPKTPHKLSKTIIQAEKLGSNSSLWYKKR